MSERMSDERLAQLEGHHSVLNRFNHVIELVDALKAEREEVERLREIPLPCRCAIHDCWNTGQCPACAEVENTMAVEDRLNRLLERLEKGTGVNAIPETTDYANGWNDCRKRAFQNQRALAKEARGDGDE